MQQSRGGREARLKAQLDSLYLRYGAGFLDTDPISFPRSHAAPDDSEVIGFVASALAYGRVRQIKNSVGIVSGLLGPRLAAALRKFDPVAWRGATHGFVHRFNDGRDMGLLLWYLRQMIERDGSVERFFLRGYRAAHDDVGQALSSFARRALALDCSPFYPGGALPDSAGVRFFLPSPVDGSACKRLNLYLRWMVRPDDGVDLGLWSGVSPSKLVIPLDTHVSRIAMRVGLTRRRSVGWRMALDVTARLRRMDPDDPVKYDFALCRLGILNAWRDLPGS